jgi:hypothetical protein
MPRARVVILEHTEEGVWLNRLDQLGEDAGDTVHGSVSEAIAQATFEYAEDLGEWTDVPDTAPDAIEYVRIILAEMLGDAT